MDRSAVLDALLDTLLPESFDGSALAYPSARSIGLAHYVETLVGGLPRGERAEFDRLLRGIDSRFANLLLTGRPVRFTALDRPRREAFLRGWSRSRLPVKRRAFSALKRLAAGSYYSTEALGGNHPFWERIHYAAPEPEAVPSDPMASLAPSRPDRDLTLAADAVVVGSGAGGSLIAARLAAAGRSVVVLESGPWIPGRRYPREERAARDALFLGRGALTTRDHAIGVLAGATVGGGTAVNWMTCLPPRPEARREWVVDGGMTGVDGGEFDRWFREVSERLGVSTRESAVNGSNDVLRRGCEALGYRYGTDWDLIPRNSEGCEGRCGFCTFGCPYDARRSALTTYLRDALGRGARLFASTAVETVEHEAGRVRGVRASYRDGGRTFRVEVRAPRVVLAAGAVHTPAILLRSDIRHRGVGAGLRLDPTTALAVEMSSPIRTWSGPHQTVGVYRFQASDEGAHGPWIEVAPAHPGLAAIGLPWEGAKAFRERLERLERVAVPIVLVRDVGEGRVEIDRDGRPLLRYRLAARDRANLVRGIVEAARIARAAGSVRISSLHTPPIEMGTGTGPIREAEWDRFVDETARRGIRENAVSLFSAHPMGSARAGPDPRTAAASPSGEVHGVSGLWIGDGSLLPSAPGANPMMSIYCLASRTSERILAAPAGPG